MSPQRLVEILRDYRVKKARLAYLDGELRTLERWLRDCTGTMIIDQISLSQAITGMPHGSGTGDPTGRLGTDIASGEVSPFVKQIQDDIRKNLEEAEKIRPEVTIVETVLQALNDREREVLLFRIIDDMDWGQTVSQMNGLHNNSYSKRTLQRLLDRAMEKAYEVVK